MADFGIFYFATDYQMQGVFEPDDRTSGPLALGPAALAAAAEERGFESVFFPEHTHIPTPRVTQWAGGPILPAEYWHTIDPFVCLAAAAAVTRRIRLGTGVAIIPQRDPFTCAKEAASVDLISNGRLLLGVGSGWNAEEMEHHGSAFADRWKITRERVLAMKAIWTQEKAEFHGDFVDFGPVLSYPKPVQPGGPPILIGSNTKWAVRRVVEYGDGWMPILVPGFMEPDGLLDELWGAAAKAGRSRDSIALSCYALNIPGGAPPDEFLLKLVDLGFTRIVLRVPSVGAEAALACLDEYAEIAARVR
jgi:probable F420-dependent oxidoreductase